MHELLTDATFWSAFGTIATGVAAFGILLARKQLQLEAWLKAQEIFTRKEFTEARGNLFQQLENRQQTWTEPQRAEARLVYRKMSELADLVPVNRSSCYNSHLTDAPQRGEYDMNKPLGAE
jgi:hypothetical protein